MENEDSAKKWSKNHKCSKGFLSQFSKKMFFFEKFLGGVFGILENDEKQQGFALFRENADFQVEVSPKLKSPQTLLYKRLRPKMQNCKNH